MAKLKKGHIIGIVSVVVISAVGGCIYLKIESDKAYDLKVSTYYSKLNAEQKAYVDANEGLIDDIFKGNTDAEIYLKNRFNEAIVGNDRLLKDSYILGDYVKANLSNSSSMAKLVEDYIRETYNTKVRVIGTKGGSGSSVQINIKDDENDIIAYFKYDGAKGVATESYGTKLTSKILSEKLTEHYKSQMPEGSKIMVWLNSAVSITEEGSIDSLVSADIDTIIRKVESSSFPVNCINVYVPVSEGFNLKDTEGYIRDILKKGENGRVEIVEEVVNTDVVSEGEGDTVNATTEGTAEDGAVKEESTVDNKKDNEDDDIPKVEGALSKANLFFMKGADKIDLLIKQLYGENPYRMSEILMPSWDAYDGVMSKDDVIDELKIDIRDKVYGYIRIKDIGSFEEDYTFEAKENMVRTKDVEKMGYLVKWYGEGIPTVDLEEKARLKAEKEKAEKEALEQAKLEEEQAKLEAEGSSNDTATVKDK